MFIRTQKVYLYHACCIEIIQRQVRRGAHLGDSLAIHFFSTISGGLPLRVRPALAFESILREHRDRPFEAFGLIF